MGESDVPQRLRHAARVLELLVQAQRLATILSAFVIRLHWPEVVGADAPKQMCPAMDLCGIRIGGDTF